MQAGGASTARTGTTWSLVRTIVGAVEVTLIVISFLLILNGVGALPFYFLFLLIVGFAFGIVIGFATLIHELGHALGAWLAGWRVIVITVWPFAFHGPTRRFVFSEKVSTQDGGGFVSAVPGSKSASTPLRRIIFCLGGPIASFIAAIVCQLLAAAPPALIPHEVDGRIIFAGVDYARESQIDKLLVGFSLLNLRSFISTIIPMHYVSGGVSDGLLIWRSLNDRDPANESWSSWVAVMLLYNTRLRNIPEWMYAAGRKDIVQFDENPAWHDGLDVARCLDAESVDTVRARALIGAYRAAYGDNDWLLNCDAWLAAAYENDVEHAERMLALRKNESTGKAMRAAADAVVAARRGQHAVVEKKLWWMDQEVGASSPFPNATFRDIRKAVEKIDASAPPAAA